jgi:flavin reductase (DIM6/NTAB) family NADH-FMN oxidoreductase RutF
VTVSPVQVAVTINTEKQPPRPFLAAGKSSATGRAESASMELIGRFGFQCSRDVDKFAGFAWARDINGVPYVTEQCAARFACTVVNEVDLGTHILFVARVDDWAVLDDVPQMTYDYYHAVKKGLTPPKASSYRRPKKR